MKRKIISLIVILVVLLGVVACSSGEESLDSIQEKIIKDNLEDWFDGQELQKYKGSNRDYDWYIDQQNTGEYASNNCGPSSAVMVMKWLDEDYSESAEEARQEHLINGGWWYTSIISKYFEDRGVKPNYLLLQSNDVDKSIEDLKKVIDEDAIALICINMDDISMEIGSVKHTDRFYSYGDGHFLVIKGYVEIDNKSYFEVYDPNSWGRTYKEGELMGKDRYYRAEEIVNSALGWYEFALVIRDSDATN
ncbi:MAG: hypothetical protein GX079_03345 [Tissierellia bacterium]|nr:hypothetical protein [Tissierellia bacterium]